MASERSDADSVAGSSLMTKSKHIDNIVRLVVAIQGNIACFTEPNDELTQFREFGEWPPHLRRRFEQ